MSASWLLSHYTHPVVIVLMMGGLYIVFTSGNLIKRMIGLAIFQTSAAFLFIALGKVGGGTAPITIEATSEAGQALGQRLPPGYAAQFGVEGVVYSNPLPHALILTAIVVGVSTLAVGLAIAVRIREAYGAVEAGEIERLDAEAGRAE
ncbi:MAG: cation:proton antiporter subunit C [Alphaproteobacteria bacterium]|nr:cation:proton antiporter subunit C [Alphaproteobacteria bacterium]